MYLSRIVTDQASFETAIFKEEANLEKAGRVCRHRRRTRKVCCLLQRLESDASNSVATSALTTFPVFIKEGRSQSIGPTIDAGHTSNPEKVRGFYADGSRELFSWADANLTLQGKINKIFVWY